MPDHPRFEELGRFVAQTLTQSPAGSLSRPLQVPTAVGEVADRLMTAIALGEFVPGERLPVERALVSMLGVSRSTVHEAIGRLRSAGIVEVRRGRAGGAFVRSDWSSNSADAVARTLGTRWSQLEELFDLRGLVEGMVARTAAERRTADDIAALNRALADFADAKTPQAEHAGDTAIHNAVTKATGNPQVAALNRGLLAAITFGIPIEPYNRDVFDRALEEHSALVESVVAGDVERAGQVAESHFAMTRRTVRGVLRRGLDGAAEGEPQPGDAPEPQPAEAGKRVFQP
jgi:GntR family transcriptional regulator, transcriptional repressor for pyruvate dehydrogenase complex